MGIDRVKDALDNTIKSTAGVMDSVYSNLDCALGGKLTEDDELALQNQNNMMKSVMSIT